MPSCHIIRSILNMINTMPRRTKPRDDLDRYIADRDAREPGFAALVADAEARLAFGRQMAERRRARGQTQTQVAARMRTSPAIVSRLESGHDVRVSTLEKYVAALGLRLELKAVSEEAGGQNITHSARQEVTQSVARTTSRAGPVVAKPLYGAGLFEFETKHATSSAAVR